MSQPGSVNDSVLARWLVLLFDCFGNVQRTNQISSSSESQGVERQLNVSHRQPHLIPPMKLVFYDEMPQSPALGSPSTHRVSQWVLHGRDLASRASRASRASDHASLTVRKKMSKQSISAPIPIAKSDDLPFRRRRSFRPLELSIYLPENRLSDLPEFTVIDFTDAGEIQVPAKALIRAKSEDVSQQFLAHKAETRPAASMVGERQLDYWQEQQQQRRPCSSATTVQRPGSACEGLNSHPVCWTSLPGLPPHAEVPGAQKSLSPMPEEEEPLPTPKGVPDSMILEFPPIHEEQTDRAATAAAFPRTGQTSPKVQIPYKKPLPQQESRTTNHHRRLPSFTNSRISQWLTRSPSSTSSTNAIIPQSQSQFYQLAISPRLPSHARTNSNNTTTTVSSNTSFYSPYIPATGAAAAATSSFLDLSNPSETESQDENDHENENDFETASLTSQTTAPTTVPSFNSPTTNRSRSGTLRSFGKHVTVVVEEHQHQHQHQQFRRGLGLERDVMPDVPTMYYGHGHGHGYGHGYACEHKGDEAGITSVRVRGDTPGLGLAF